MEVPVNQRVICEEVEGFWIRSFSPWFLNLSEVLHLARGG
jgi:hypothetical protein